LEDEIYNSIWSPGLGSGLFYCAVPGFVVEDLAASFSAGGRRNWSICRPAGGAAGQLEPMAAGGRTGLASQQAGIAG